MISSPSRTRTRALLRIVSRLSWACGLLSAALLCTSTLAAGSQPIQTKSRDKCGPPSYCARTDRKTEAYPDNPPEVGAAGSIITDPSFGSRVVRVTDPKSDRQGKGRSMMTPSSSEQNSWNLDSTRFYVLTPGGEDILYQFDPSSMKLREGEIMRLGWMPEPQFSYTNPDLIYGINNRVRGFEQYDIGNGKVETLNKFGDCLKLDGRDKGHDITVSADDSRFSASVGPVQDEYEYVYVFDRKQGCRWYNTWTGEVGGQWGPKGTISIPDRARLHNSRMSKSGKYLYMTRGSGQGVGKGWLVWDIDTLNVRTCPSQCRSHHALGYNQIVGASGFTHPLDMIVRPLGDLGKITHLIPDLKELNGARFWYDQHYSWNNANADDTAPVCLSTYNSSNPKAPRTPPLANSAWENEIVCVSTNGTGKVWRFAHTYSTAKNGFWSTPRGNVSQDGRFFAFTSDWEDQLGQGPRGGFRTDVFVVALE